MASTKLTIKARPTIRDVQEQVAEVHQCLHVVDSKVDVTSVQVAMVAQALGLKLPTAEELKAGAEPRAVRRRLGGMHPWQVAAWAAPVVTLGMGAYKVIEPAVVAAAVALHHALMLAK